MRARFPVPDFAPVETFWLQIDFGVGLPDDDAWSAVHLSFRLVFFEPIRSCIGARPGNADPVLDALLQDYDNQTRYSGTCCFFVCSVSQCGLGESDHGVCSPLLRLRCMCMMPRISVDSRLRAIPEARTGCTSGFAKPRPAVSKARCITGFRKNSDNDIFRKTLND